MPTEATPGVRVLVSVGVPDANGSAHAAIELDDILVEFLERGVRAVLLRESVSEAEISLTLLEDDGIRDLNRRYLDRDRTTDVIAFPLYEPGEPVVGDVYLGAGQARRQAAELGIPVDEELLRLAVHGTLHVLGHDHPEDGDRESSEMFRIQEETVEGVLESRK